MDPHQNFNGFYKKQNKKRNEKGKKDAAFFSTRMKY